jgi:hypothetical protein
MPQRKPWSVFVYLVADDQVGSPANSLDEVAEDELDLMFDAVDRHMHLAVQVDFRHKQRVWRHLERRPLTSLSESSAADPQTLNRFFEWAFDTCPAERYLVLFWGHAFGTAGLFPDSRPKAPGSRDLLSVKELARVLTRANENYIDGRIDGVLFKNCCLSNLETVYQLQDCAEIMIASQARLPARGWPYDALFNELRDVDDIERVGSRLTHRLASFYADTQPHRDVPVTSLRLRVARQLRSPLARVVEGLRSLRDASATQWENHARTALRRAALIGDPALPDVISLCRHLRSPGGPYQRRLSESAQALEHTVNRQLVLSHYSKTSGFNGVGVFYRSTDTIARSQSIVADVTDVAEYRSLALCQDTNWDEVAIERAPGPAVDIAKTLESTASWR